jgi:protein-L-isoaspartate(D-aspartate) O-methyltransferase
MIEAAQQRTNMVDSQILTSDVTDRRILRAMGTLPRERFVPPQFATLAYMDEAVPLTSGEPGSPRRWLMAPRALAKLLQLAEIEDTDRVLDVGAGSGYAAAVLAHMAKAVVALECDAALADAMRQNLAELAIDNVSVAVGPLAAGWASEGPYDAVILDGAIDDRAAQLLDQLKDGGRLVAVVSHAGVGKATIWRRLGRSFDRWTAFDAAAPALPGFAAAAAFAL